ncbi:hypothetical protein DQ04_01831110 [Trypanosoma grayi]|uniref:hypothetical protein n=1 Tax=Trypanosoma grayi TaxID=71804 RepID=UPI0004F4104E|nr:hypothetical protein DQ04_01831110 [Trypanosoma grayi]KEG12293.1 hypothetical protein DQ04_01831110 [Trypanosoma grayi]
MNEVQLRAAESYKGLLEAYSTSEESLVSSRSKIRALNEHYEGSDLQKSLGVLESTMNASINTDVYVGTVCTRVDDAVMDVLAERVMLPIGADVAHSLYAKLDPSLVGVERRGDVLDPSLRMSHEAAADVLRIGGPLASFDFPEEVRRVHEHLCPSAMSIRVQLYKLVIYGEGDFFVPHRDSMSSADMLGSISLQLPVAHDTDTVATEADREARGVKRHGQLVFYVGRNSTEAGENSISTTSLYSGCYDEQEQFAQTVDLGALSSAVAEDGTITMSYAAWTGDVLHEVRRVENGYRAVLLYRLYKQGHKVSYISASLRTTVTQGIARVMSAMALGSTKGSGDGDDESDFRYLGVVLRHAYPPAGLQPEFLKGVDAVMHNIASMTNQCLLFNAYEMREGTFGSRHLRCKEAVARMVFLTTDATPSGINFSDEDALEAMGSQYKLFAKTAWVVLGLGTLVGGGFCFGNADCGTDWWYRAAVMIVTPEPSLWKRRRGLFLVTSKGPECMRGLLSNLDVMERIASFL